MNAAKLKLADVALTEEQIPECVLNAYKDVMAAGDPVVIDMQDVFGKTCTSKFGRTELPELTETSYSFSNGKGGVAQGKTYLVVVEESTDNGVRPVARLVAETVKGEPFRPQLIQTGQSVFISRIQVGAEGRAVYNTAGDENKLKALSLESPGLQTIEERKAYYKLLKKHAAPQNNKLWWNMIQRGDSNVDVIVAAAVKINNCIETESGLPLIPNVQDNPRRSQNNTTAQTEDGSFSGAPDMIATAEVTG